MTWQDFDDWHTLWDGEARFARLYHEDYHPRWRVYLSRQDQRIQLDPTLTWEEAKLVVQTLAGAQL